jgi:prepilin-type processing-associated H-X9-DG protein
MKISSSHRKSDRAFTKVELVIVIVGLAVLLGAVFLPSLARLKMKNKRIKCINSLKQVGLSFRLFAIDDKAYYPMQVSTNEGGSLEYVGSGETFRHFLALSNEINVPRVLICPVDDSSRIEAKSFQKDFIRNQNTSYFVGLDSNEENGGTILSGDRYLEIDSKRVTGVIDLSKSANFAWSTNYHGGYGNVAFGDGSVAQLDDTGLRRALAESGNLTNRVSIPD